MSALQSGYKLGQGSSPIIYNIMNFAKPPEGEPALLSLDEAQARCSTNSAMRCTAC